MVCWISLTRRCLAGTRQPHHDAVAALQIGLWLNGTQGCRDLVAGRLQRQVRRLYRYLMVEGGRRAPKIFLRVGYEFDNPSFGYYSNGNGEQPPEQVFPRAFRYLVNECYRLYSESQCSRRIAFVWHSWAAGIVPPNNDSNTTATTTTTTLSDFYPGDDYVDWIGVSLFSQLYNPDDDDDPHRLGNRETVVQVLDFAAAHDKPTMIAESTPFGGIDRIGNGDPWRAWFDPVLALIEEYDISMFSYINCDWDSQPLWHGVGFGDSRLSTNRTVLQLWRQNVLENPRFAATTSPLSSCGSSNSGGGGGSGGDDAASKALLVSPTLLLEQGLSGRVEMGGSKSFLNDPDMFPYWILMVASVSVLVTLFCSMLHCRGGRRGSMHACHCALTEPDVDNDKESLVMKPSRPGYGTLKD